MDNKELLERDRYFLEKAANVTPEERKMSVGWLLEIL